VVESGRTLLRANQHTLEAWGWFDRQPLSIEHTGTSTTGGTDMRSPIRTRLAAVLAALALALAACGDDDTGVASSGDPAEPGEATGADPTDADDDAAFPVTVTSGGVDTEIASRPEAIVSLSPTATEMLFAIGAGGQVAAVDEFSTFPPEAPITDLSGYEPNLEAVIGYDPDLVLLQGPDDALTEGLDAAAIPSIVLPAAATLDDTYSQIELLGAATGRVGDAAELVGQMQGDIEALLADVPERDEPLTYFHELDELLYTVTSETFIGQLYGLLGLENIADDAEGAAEAGGYPQLSAELVVAADPDVIFLADAQCCDQSPETVAARAGWNEISAVREGRIVVLDEDVASRWGPRVVEMLETIVDAVAEVEVDAAAGAEG
jgi:iron complex transport system substrate-binding protein